MRRGNGRVGCTWCAWGECRGLRFARGAAQRVEAMCAAAGGARAGASAALRFWCARRRTLAHARGPAARTHTAMPTHLAGCTHACHTHASAQHPRTAPTYTATYLAGGDLPRLLRVSDHGVADPACACARARPHLGAVPGRQQRWPAVLPRPLLARSAGPQCCCRSAAAARCTLCRPPVLHAAARLHDLQLGGNLGAAARGHLVHVHHGRLAWGRGQAGRVLGRQQAHGRAGRMAGRVPRSSWHAPISSVTSLAMFMDTPGATTAEQARRGVREACAKGSRDFAQPRDGVLCLAACCCCGACSSTQNNTHTHLAGAGGGRGHAGGSSVALHEAGGLHGGWLCVGGR